MGVDVRGPIEAVSERIAGSLLVTPLRSPDVSVVICTHNPRLDSLARVLAALETQTLPQHLWELVVVDNASGAPVSPGFDLSWHRAARHVREDVLGLACARSRGIAESSGRLLVFVDDDCVLQRDYLQNALALEGRYPQLGAFGAGIIQPQFEVPPPAAVRPYLRMLAIRDVPAPRWSNNVDDADSIPWGAGLCVTRRVAESWGPFLGMHGLVDVVARKGDGLLAGDDDVFSWVASSFGLGFGVFPDLTLTHLIPADRVREAYFLRLIRDHAFSHALLRYRTRGVQPPPAGASRYAHLLLHGLRNGRFSMQCQWARSRGEARALDMIREESAHRSAT